jgi:glycosyltransferase involved in cell wall biosynthesis
MKVLLVSISAPPKNSPESVQVGRYFEYLSKENDITLLTTKTTGGWQPDDQSLLKYIKNASRIIRLGTLHPKLITIIKRIYPSWLIPDDSVFFSWQFKRALFLIHDKPDVIISRSAPYSSALLALRFSQNLNCPWIMHLSDPWADNPFHIFSRRAAIKNERLEHDCIKQATLVTLTSHKTIRFYQQKYPQFSSKFRFLPNVFDDQYINTKEVAFDGKIKFVFTGRLYGNRNVHAFLHAVELAVDTRPDLIENSEFIFIGFFGDDSINRINQSKLTNIKYLGPLSMQDALQKQHEATVLIAIDGAAESEIYELFFPSKLLDYLAAKRPIIALTGKDSTTYNVIEKRFGKCFHEDNLSELPSYIISIFDSYRNQDKDIFSVFSNIDEYSASKNASRLQEMLNEVVG